MRLAHRFQGQTVKGQGYRRAGAYSVGRTRQPHCLLSRRSRQRERLDMMGLSICLSVSLSVSLSIAEMQKRDFLKN